MKREFVQLGRHDVDPATLEGAGSGLEQLRTRYELSACPWPLMVPEDGWRVVAEDQSVLVLAAPAGDHWARIELEKRDGRFDWRGSGGALVRPGRAARRAGLRLHWPADPLIGTVGQPLTLQIMLSNNGSATWENGEGAARDELVILAHIHDQDGVRLPTRGRIIEILGPGRSVHLAPGGSLNQEVMIVSAGVEQLPPGEYGLSAQWIDLQLESEPGRLRLVQAS